MALAVLNAPTSGMRVEIEESFDFLSPAYRAFHGGGRGTAFQAPLWMDHLHRRLAPALGARQRTVTIRDHDDTLLAVLPMVLQRSSGVSMLQPADFGVCDYNCVVADAETLERLAGDETVLMSLGKVLKGADLVMFRKIRADGFDAGRFFPRARQSAGENPAYACHLDDDFDVWRLKVLKRKFTKDLGRLQRQAEAEHGSYEHHAVSDPVAIAAAFDFLRDVRQERYDDNLLNRPDYFSFYRDYAIAAAAEGEAVTYVSYLQGKPIAVLFGLAGDGDFHATLIAADILGHPKLSSGMQIIYQVAKMRHQQGYRILDLCLGDPGYKSHFRPVKTLVNNVTVALTLKGTAVSTVYHHAKPLKNLLKKGAPNVR